MMRDLNIRNEVTQNEQTPDHFEEVVFNEITLQKNGEHFVLRETMTRIWHDGKYQDYNPISTDLPAAIGEKLLRLLVEQIKFQNSVVTGIRTLAKSPNQRCTYTNSNENEIINCKL